MLPCSTRIGNSRGRTGARPNKSGDRGNEGEHLETASNAPQQPQVLPLTRQEQCPCRRESRNQAKQRQSFFWSFLCIQEAKHQ